MSAQFLIKIPMLAIAYFKIINFLLIIVGHRWAHIKKISPFEYFFIKLDGMVETYFCHAKQLSITYGLVFIDGLLKAKRFGKITSQCNAFTYSVSISHTTMFCGLEKLQTTSCLVMRRSPHFVFVYESLNS